MKVTVQFSKVLSNKLGFKSIAIDVTRYRDVIDACQVLIPSIFELINNKSVVYLLSADRLISPAELDFTVKEDLITIVPSVAGGAPNSFDSLGNLNIFYGASKAYSNEEVLLSGMNRRILESSLFGKAQTAFDITQRKSLRQDGTIEGSEDPTTGFGSLNITSVYGQPVPLNYGLVRVSGSVINSYIKHIQRGSVDNTKVSDYV